MMTHPNDRENFNMYRKLRKVYNMLAKTLERISDLEDKVNELKKELEESKRMNDILLTQLLDSFYGVESHASEN